MGDLPAPDAGKWYGRMRQGHHRCDYGRNGGTVPFPARRPSKFSWCIYIYITGVCFHSICSSLKMGTSSVHHHEIIQVTSKCSYLKGSMSPPKAVRKVLSLFLNVLFKRFIMDMLVVPIGGFFAALQSKIGYRRLHAKHRTVSMTSQINDPHDDSIRRTEAFKRILNGYTDCSDRRFLRRGASRFRFIGRCCSHSSQIMMSQKPGPEDDMMAMIYVLTYLYSGMLFISVSGFLLLLHGSSWLASPTF